MKTVLISPLGWGLGHATRDIPIIKHFLELGFRVIVAADKQQLELLKHSVKGIEYVYLPSISVMYTSGRSQLLPMIKVAFGLPFANCREHKSLQYLVAKYKIDLVISDNRYGLWSNKCKSVIITHQLGVIPPFPFRWASFVARFITKRWLSRFNQVWVPDFEHRPLAGRLSSNIGIRNLKYIGLLSRFYNYKPTTETPTSFEMVVVASGPEPHRQIFVDIAAAVASKHALNCLIIEGKQSNGLVPRLVDGVWFVGHLSDSMFAQVVTSAKYLLLRSGYSTIMDMLVLGVLGLLVPTPGQTEQEYLARNLSEHKLFRTVSQSNLSTISVEDMLAIKVKAKVKSTVKEAIVSAIN